MMKDTYPPNWKEIADRIKAKSGWRCERCGHANCPETGHTLTVHHLVPIKALCEDWNLAALCQRCHLSIQSRVNMFQGFFGEHSRWMKPHVIGFEEWMERQKKLEKTEASQ